MLSFLWKRFKGRIAIIKNESEPEKKQPKVEPIKGLKKGLKKIQKELREKQ